MIRTLFQLVGQKVPPAGSAFTPDLLAFADRTQLTLQLRAAPGLPAWLAQEIETRYHRNAIRRRQLRDAYSEIATLLTARNIDYILLKGFTHETGFGIDPDSRIQYDLDFLVAPASLAPAREALASLGYAPHGDQSLSDEHSRPLVRPSAWRWRGDYFDTEMHIPVELHDSLWNPGKDRLPLSGIEDFWTRRRSLSVNGLTIPALAESDRLAFAALHALRHILRHDARPAHVLELARFLETRAHDHAFWTAWRGLYPPHLKALQIVAFRFAQEWFGCSWPAAVAEEWASQPSSMTAPVTSWFREFAWSPAENLLRPNKDTVWLHMALTATARDRVRVFCDRLAPLRLPHRQEPAPYSARLVRRMRYHAAALAPALARGVRWWWRRDTSSTASHISDW
jgi:hypothetical protein